MDVSVIIVNYNTARLTCEAIESVRQLTHGINYEILVVDNASSDDSRVVIPARCGDAVRYLPLEENTGFGRANNVGIKQATGRNIFLLNPDTILLNNAIKILSDYLDGHPECGICGGNLYDADRTPTHSFQRVLPGIGFEINTLLLGLPFRLLFGRNRVFNYRRRPLQVGYITGADMMIRADVLKQTGAFDPDFFMYYEETELTHRIRKAGYRVMSVPSAEIIHLEGKSFTTHPQRSERVWNGRQIFLRKVYGKTVTNRINRLYLFTCRLRSMLFFWHPARRTYWQGQIKLVKKSLR